MMLRKLGFLSNKNVENQPEHTRGCLVVPKDAYLYRCDPEIVVTISKDTYLLSKPPYASSSSYKKKKEEDYLQRESSSPVVAPILGIVSKLEKGTRVLARVCDVFNPNFESNTESVMSPSALKAATFQETNNIDPTLPEMGRGIKILQSGYIFRDVIKKQQDYFRAFKENIFPKGNVCDPNAIKQTVFGDCYYLSPMMSIINSDGGMEWMMDHMIQKDKTTIVKLYHPETKQPVYIEVGNTFYCEGEADSVQHLQPFIHILEKAFAVLAAIEVDPETKTLKPLTDPSFRVAYGEGGYCQTAYAALTGQDVKVTQLHPTETELGTDIYHPWSKTIGRIAKGGADAIKREKDANIISQIKINLEKSCAGLCKENIVMVCFKSIDNLLAWGDYLNKLFDTNRLAYDELSKMIEAMDNSPFLVTQDQVLDFTKRLAIYKAPAKLIALFEKYILTPRADEKTKRMIYRYPAHIADACYTDNQLKYFDDIVKKLENNCLISVSTLKKFKIENDALGLRHQHAYAVLYAKEMHLQDKTFYMIKLRNPWGQTGRVYDFNKINTPDFISEEKSSAEFWIELSDFMRYFESYTACDVSKIGLKNYMVLQKEQQELTQGSQLKSTASNMHN